MRTSLFWYTKDLRLEDLPALAEAASRSDQVVPVYIWDNEYLQDEADNREAFLIDCLEDLDRALRSVGSGLSLRTGDTLHELLALTELHKVTDIYATASRD